MCRNPCVLGTGVVSVWLGSSSTGTSSLSPSIEIDQKLQEIMKQTGYLTIGGQVPPRWGSVLGWGRGAEAGTSSSSGCPCQRYQAEINDLENLGEMGSGTCGQVWKMRFRKTGHVIAVKVRAAPAPRWAPCPKTLALRLPWLSTQQMRRSGNKEENKRILMDLDVVLKSHDCPYIVQCFGTFITNVSPHPLEQPPMGPCRSVGSPTLFLAHLWVSPRGWSLCGVGARVRLHPSHPVPSPQTDVFIAMELMGTCAEKLKKRVQGPIPERILGKMTVAVSSRAGLQLVGCHPLPPPRPIPPSRIPSCCPRYRS